MKPLDQLVWVDLETTGLDPEKDQILEVAIVITTAYSLQTIAGNSWACAPVGGLPALRDVVLNMHSKSGLLARLHDAAPLWWIDQCAAAMIPPAWRGGPICGSSVHFDKLFLDRHMPLFSKCFNHRVFDVSTLKQAMCQATGKDSPDADIAPAHRALDDINYSIGMAREILVRPWPGAEGIR